MESSYMDQSGVTGGNVMACDIQENKLDDLMVPSGLKYQKNLQGATVKRITFVNASSPMYKNLN